MARHKVVLYNPKAVFFDMPLALLAIGSALDPEQYEVVIVDARIDENPFERLKKACEDAVIFGVTALTGSPVLDALKMTQRVKEAYPDLPVVWGGWHTSLFPTEPMEEEKSIDVTVQGQGEITFRELVEAAVNKTGFEGINGCCYRIGHEIKKNPPRALTDMNELPAVNYDLIEVEAYFKKKGRRQLDYISSTGCYFRCTFCADPFVFGRNFTAIEPERMGEELGALYEKYQFTDVNFQDETFFTYRKRVMAIADEFISRGIKATWAGTMRADQGHRMSDEDFETCAQSGLRRVLVGVESGSQEMMDWLKKDIKIEYVWECAERCRKYGIDVIFPFIVGFPGESDKSVRDTLTTANGLRKMSPGFSTPIFYFKPYPGSAITQEVTKNGYSLPTTLEEWGEFDYIGSSGPWVSDEKYRLIERFKFYSKLAWTHPRWYLWPAQSLARWRLKKDRFGFAFEKALVEKIRPAQKLS